MNLANFVPNAYPLLVVGACGTRYRVREWTERHAWIGVRADRKGDPKPERERLVRKAGAAIIQAS